MGIVPFPYVPEDFQTWVTQELNYRPVFFGCNSSNYTSITLRNGTFPSPLPFPGPLILYLPNAPWSYYTNTSTFQLDYVPTEILGFFDNGELQISQSPKQNNTYTKIPLPPQQPSGKNAWAAQLRRGVKSGRISHWGKHAKGVLIGIAGEGGIQRIRC